MAAVAALPWIAQPAAAAEWVPGGSFDPALGVATYFLRYVAAEPGQMVIRCMAGEGVTIDAGATGAGPPPAGVKRDTAVDATFILYKAGQSAPAGTFRASGLPRARADNSIVVTVGGGEIDGMAKLLLLPLDHIDITIADAKASVSMDGAADKVARIASACPGWPK